MALMSAIRLKDRVGEAGDQNEQEGDDAAGVDAVIELGLPGGQGPGRNGRGQGRIGHRSFRGIFLFPGGLKFLDDVRVTLRDLWPGSENLFAIGREMLGMGGRTAEGDVPIGTNEDDGRLTFQAVGPMRLAVKIRQRGHVLHVEGWTGEDEARPHVTPGRYRLDGRTQRAAHVR